MSTQTLFFEGDEGNTLDRVAVETEDADPGDSFDHWVLPDVFGGTTGLLAKVGTGPREPVFEHFDAFGGGGRWTRRGAMIMMPRATAGGRRKGARPMTWP